MNSSQTLLAKRYAQAFFNLYGEHITTVNFSALMQLKAYLAESPHHLPLLMISHIDDQTKSSLLHKFLEPFNLHVLLDPLIQILIKDKRVFLLPEVAKQLLILYKNDKKIMLCTVTSSHALTVENLAVIQNFLARSTGYDIIYDYKINKDLIAGIRLQSDTVLWEYSIRRQLARVELPLIR